MDELTAALAETTHFRNNYTNAQLQIERLTDSIRSWKVTGNLTLSTDVFVPTRRTRYRLFTQNDNVR